jgi:hypothetical protein
MPQLKVMAFPWGSAVRSLIFAGAIVAGALGSSFLPQLRNVTAQRI